MIVSTPRPAPGYVDLDDEESNGWPLSSESLRSVPRAPAPHPVRRRSFLDVAWISLGVLGVVAALVASAWYVRIRGATPGALSVPHVIGLSEKAAVRELTTAGFAVRAIEQPSAASPGIVFAQRPDAHARLARGELVTIRVANHQAQRSVTGIGSR
jgi:PASTA domain